MTGEPEPSQRDTEAPAAAEGTPLTTDDEAQRSDTPADPDTEAS